MTNPERIANGLYWDRAWSLVRGCSKVSEGCRHCWAERESHMRAFNPNEKVKAQYAGLTDGDGRFNGKIRLMEKNLDLPQHVRKPTVWAVWNDLFHEDVPTWFIFEALNVVRHAKQHIILVLTKRIELMKEYMDWYYGKSGVDKGVLPNLWLGTTCENQEQADKRIPVLLQIPAAVRFVSVEPMLSEINLSRYLKWPVCKMWPSVGGDPHIYGKYQWQRQGLVSPDWTGLDWVICGGESGPGRRPTDINCIRSLRDQCVASGTRFFLKQMDIGGKLVKMPVLDGREWNEMPVL